MAARYTLLVYDIPQRLKFPNPSCKLRRVGTRINLSCWLIPEQYVPYDLLDVFLSKGIAHSLVRFDENEAEKIRELARQGIGAELARIKVAMVAAIARGQRLLGTHEKWTPEKFDKHAKAVLRRAKKALKDAEEAAILFDLAADLGEARQIVADAVAAGVEAYVLRKGNGLFVNPETLGNVGAGVAEGGAA